MHKYTEKKLIAWKSKKVIFRCNNYTDMTELTDNENKHGLLLLCDIWFKIDFVSPQSHFSKCHIYSRDLS